jgi:hypothetical protein
MIAMTHEEYDDQEEIQNRERTTIDEAREEGIGKPEEGVELEMPSYTDPGGVSDLGVDEPVVPPGLRGSPPPDKDENA